MQREPLITIQVDVSRSNIGVDLLSYNEPMQDWLKRASPAETRGRGRGWDDLRKIWVLPLDDLNIVEEVLSRFCDDLKLEYSEVPFVGEETVEEEES